MNQEIVEYAAIGLDVAHEVMTEEYPHLRPARWIRKVHSRIFGNCAHITVDYWIYNDPSIPRTLTIVLKPGGARPEEHWHAHTAVLTNPVRDIGSRTWVFDENGQI